MPPINLLERRRIEAEFTKGLLEVLSAEIGRERAISLLTKAIEAMAETAGAAFAQELQTQAQGTEVPGTEGQDEASTDLRAFAKILPRWQGDNALSLSLTQDQPDALDFDVTRCAFAEMYQALGLGDLGHVLSCNRDGGFSKGFNPDIELTRTQTIMEGATHCDFRFRLPRP
jgi:hypothetical protein